MQNFSSSFYLFFTNIRGRKYLQNLVLYIDGKHRSILTRCFPWSKSMMVPATLHELEKIEMVRRNHVNYRLDHGVTKKQKTILSTLGMDEEYVRSKAKKIGILPASGKSPMDAYNKSGKSYRELMTFLGG